MIVGVDILFLFESYRFDLCCDTSCVFGNWVSGTMVWIIFSYARAGIYTLRVGSYSGVYTLKLVNKRWRLVVMRYLIVIV
jgi:hypothetical protein